MIYARVDLYVYLLLLFDWYWINKFEVGADLSFGTLSDIVFAAFNVLEINFCYSIHTLPRNLSCYQLYKSIACSIMIYIEKLTPLKFSVIYQLHIFK